MNYAKLLEISSFFTCHIFLEVGKTQNMPSKIWQTLGDALTRNYDANRAPRAYIYALEAGFYQVTKNCQVFCQTVGGVFLMFLPKIKDINSICQTAGDALTTPILCHENYMLIGNCR